MVGGMNCWRGGGALIEGGRELEGMNDNEWMAGKKSRIRVRMGS